MTCKTDECDKIYVRWTWAVVILSTSLMTIAGISWAGGSKMADNESRIRVVENRVDEFKKMDIKIDTIVTILRAIK